MNKYQYIWVLQGYYSRREDLTSSEKYSEVVQDLHDYVNNMKGVYRIIRRNKKGIKYE